MADEQSARVYFNKSHYAGNTGSNNHFNTNNSCCQNHQRENQSSAPLSQSQSPEPADTQDATWVTELPEYEAWLGNKAPGVLHLEALPDQAGKKCLIASRVLDNLKARANTFVCHFSFREHGGEPTRAAFGLHQIVSQLSTQGNSLSRYVREALAVGGENDAAEVDRLWGILVRAVSEAACVDVICVVDSLDECEEATMLRFVRLLSCLSGLRTADKRLKFLVISRPHSEITRILGPPVRPPSSPVTATATKSL